MMTRTVKILPVVAALALAATAAYAHAFLDHAEPAVGRTVTAAPTEVRLWFTQKLEPKFSKVQVFDGQDKQVDRGDSHVESTDPAELVASLPPLVPGAYKVVWRVVSVDTHVTDGRYEFTVARP